MNCYRIKRIYRDSGNSDLVFMLMDQPWIKYSFLGVLYAVAFNCLWVVSTQLELIPNVVSWYLPAGLRICVFLFSPIRSWPYLFVIDRIAFLLLFHSGGWLSSPVFYPESLIWYVTHFVLYPFSFIFLLWQYRKRFGTNVLTSLNNACALLVLFIVTSVTNATLFVGRRALDDPHVAINLIQNITNMALGDLVGIFFIFPLVLLTQKLLFHFDEKSVAAAGQCTVVWLFLLSGYFFLTIFHDGYDQYVKLVALLPAVFYTFKYGVIGAMCSVFFVCAMTYMVALLTQGPTVENQIYMIAISICLFLIAGAEFNKRQFSTHTPN